MTPSNALAAPLVAALITAVAVSLLVAIRRARRPPDASRHVLDAVTRVAAGWTTLGLAGVAAAISYQHLLTLATRHGETGWRAHAFPLSVDGLEVVASLVLLADRRDGRRSGWLPWAALVGGTTASVCANIIVADRDPIARAIAAWPALALITATKLFLSLADRRTPETTTAQEAGGPPVVASASDLNGRPRDRPPVALMRRIPVDEEAYQRWLAAWSDLRHDGTDPRAVADRHNVSLRQIQFIRRAGERGLLDSPIPPALRLAAIATADDGQSTRGGSEQAAGR
jgi:hypothetical protein